MSINVLNTKEELEEIIHTHQSFFLLKHSLTCPISASAKEEYEQFSENSTIPCFILYVQEARDLSNAIATEYHVRHESPQVLLFQGPEVVWDASHGSITDSRLKAAHSN